MIQKIASIKELRTLLEPLRKHNKTIGFVPTMGALHSGHLSLVKQSQESCDITVVSIFVNPKQFGPNEDLDSYPRTLDKDIKKLSDACVDIVFFPDTETMYPTDGLAPTNVHVPELSPRYCGISRPVFFDGICTVVSRLLNIVQPTHAFFGEKDFQQVTIIKKMVIDLFIPTQIVSCPIIREPSGLAMSSRNKYLTPKESHNATSIYTALNRAKALFHSGETSASILIQGIIDEVSQHEISTDYCVLVDSSNLNELTTAREGARFLFAGTCSHTRLIDNLAL